MRKKSQKTIYYKEEQDELVDYKIKRKALGKNFKYQNNNLLFRFTGFTLYHVVAKPLISLIMKFTYGGKIVNKKVFKKFKNHGIFIYGNHTGSFVDAFQPNRLRKKKNYIICNPDAVSITGIRNLVMMLGALPLADSYEYNKALLLKIDDCISKKKSITIYPEAHIWPFYTKIRDFPDSSFSYPVRLDAPCFAMTTTYQRRKIGKMPKIVTYIDGPFYPDQSLSLKDAKTKLRNQIYDAMKIRTVNNSTYEYYKYEKINESKD